MTRPLREIPRQKAIPWGVAVAVSWGSLRRRFVRSLITMAGVILAIAFLSYMLVTNNILAGLIELSRTDTALETMLLQKGVDVRTAGTTDEMTILLMSLALLTCLVGIINSMLMSVTERVKEIGTLKCLGALDGFITQTYFIESSLQGIIGTGIGMGIGLTVALTANTAAYGVPVLAGFPVAPVVASLVIALFVGSLISVLASIAPAMWAARKQPVEAMRVEE